MWKQIQEKLQKRKIEKLYKKLFKEFEILKQNNPELLEKLLFEKISGYHGDVIAGHLYIGWCRDDVRGTLNEEYFLTDEECDEVLEYLGRKHDASLGINWDVIETTLWSLNYDKKHKKDPFCEECKDEFTGKACESCLAKLEANEDAFDPDIIDQLYDSLVIGE